MSWISEVTSILATQAVTNDLVVSSLETALDIDVSHGKRITALEERLAALEKPAAPTLPTVSEWIAANYEPFTPCCVSVWRDSDWRGDRGGNLPDDVFNAIRGGGSCFPSLKTFDTPTHTRAALADALIRLGKARPDMPEPK